MTHLPPGPRTPRLLTTYRLLAQPLRWYPRWTARYGDPFTLEAVNGTVVTTGRPDLIEAIFRADRSTYSPFGAEAVGPLVGQSSVFLLRGDAHRRERKLMMPAFHGARMRAYADVMAAAAVRGLSVVDDGQVHPLQPAMQSISLEVILRAVFGVDDDDDPSRYGAAIVELIDRVHPAFLFMPFMQRRLGGFGPYAAFLRQFEVVERMLEAQIARRRETPGDDILSMLLAARYDDGTAMEIGALKDELRTMVVAGHETAALALSWALDAVHRDPKVAAKLRDEIDGLGQDPDPEALTKLPYLDAVCKETLRLYPIVTESLRKLDKPLQLGEWEVPAGAAVSPSILMAHRDPDIYPDPERFDPERFLAGTPGPFEYLPFGGGHRRCVGAAFAQFEMKIVLGTLMSRYEVELASPTRPAPVRRNITLAPADGVPARLTARRTRLRVSSPGEAPPASDRAGDQSRLAG